MNGAITMLLDASNYVLILMLVALGLAIVFGLMNVINMAHGEFMMLGAYAALACHEAGLPLAVGLLVAPLAVGLLGLAIEELLIRRVYARLLDTILATWGLSLILKQSIVMVFGPGSYSVPNPLPMTVPVLGVEYPAYRLFIMAVALAALVATFLLFFRTEWGLAARSVIANRSMAACLGIDTRRLDRLTFACGAALAGLAGAVITPIVSLDPQMGTSFLVPAFLSILVGGLGSVAAPLAGATAVGATDNLVSTFYSPVWAQGVVFTVAILLIRAFPDGVMARVRRRA
ncbi:MAG TPA: branched-chain amino acid ABC transporter permease [Burkholderiaceae bacterium]|nr:branched-chain amino acid ABC transporter permease [Burkholderiaceae bacterium]